ncbi:hypothetical protein Pst134EB_001474 [Puccinia striiformis f. sp. tritici]|nr:hypothetical protein Pst134EB_001474 [Puccinia striiformis f. sp. tritici]
MSSSQARHNNRQSILSQSVDEWSNQEHMMEIKNLKHELTEERQLKEDLIGDNQDLRHRLIETKNALQDTQDEIHRLSRNEEHGYQRSQQISRAQSSRFDPEDRHPDDYTSSGQFKNEIEDLSKLCRDLEHENIELKSKVNSQIKLLSTKNSEKDNLNNQVINLKRKVLDLQDELDQDLPDEVREKREKKEIDELNAELDDRESYFNDEIQKLTNQFNSEIDIIKSERDELQEVLDEREDQITELSDQNKLKEKEQDYNSILQDLEAAQTDLKEIGGGNRELAAEVNDKDQQILDLNAELDELEQEASNRATVHEQVIAKLKQGLAQAESDIAHLKGKLEIREEDIRKLENMLKRSLKSKEFKEISTGTNSEIQSLKEANLNLKNQFSKFQATISSLDELSDKLEGVQRARDSLNERYEEQTKNLRETRTISIAH